MPEAIDQNLAELMLERIADILIVVADVGSGDYSTRLRSNLPENHALSTLYEGINQMIESLSREQDRSGTYQKELEEKLATIEVQRAAIRELSTPIIEVWEGVLCLPVVGVLDTVRSTEMTDSLLEAVVQREVDCTIVDITGIDVMDTRTADHFLRMSRAVRLLGARCMLSGVNPTIAQTMVHMGVEMHGIEFHRSLRDALKMHLPLIEKARRAGKRK